MAVEREQGQQDNHASRESPKKIVGSEGLVRLFHQQGVYTKGTWCIAIGLIFSILIVFALLLTVSCTAAIGHFMLVMLAAREQQRVLAATERQEAERLAQAAREPVPEPTPPEELNARLVLITAQPSIRFTVNETAGLAGTDPILPGTALVRLGPNNWAGASRTLNDNEIRRLIESGYAVAQEHRSVTSEQASRMTSQMLEQANRMVNESLRRMQQSLPPSFQSLFDTLGPWNFSTVLTQNPAPSQTEGSKPKADPVPKPASPKSAIDRLLEDELLADDDSGVK